MSYHVFGVSKDTTKEVLEDLGLTVGKTFKDRWSKDGIAFEVAPPSDQFVLDGDLTQLCKHGLRLVYHALVGAGANKADNIDTSGHKSKLHDIDLIAAGDDFIKSRDEVSWILDNECNCDPSDVEEEAFTIPIAPDLEDEDEESVRKKIRFGSSPEYAEGALFSFRMFNYDMEQGLVGLYGQTWDFNTMTASCASTGHISSKKSADNYGITTDPTPMEMLIFEETESPIIIEHFTDGDDDSPQIRCEKHLAVGLCASGNNGCGIWSYKDPFHVGGGGYTDDGTAAIGGIAVRMTLGGVILPAKLGYRSSKARMEQFWIVKERKEKITIADKGIVQMLENHYEGTEGTVITDKQWLDEILPMLREGAGLE